MPSATRFCHRQIYGILIRPVTLLLLKGMAHRCLCLPKAALRLTEGTVAVMDRRDRMHDCAFTTTSYVAGQSGVFSRPLARVWHPRIPRASSLPASQSGLGIIGYHPPFHHTQGRRPVPEFRVVAQLEKTCSSNRVPAEAKPRFDFENASSV